VRKNVTDDDDLIAAADVGERNKRRWLRRRNIVRQFVFMRISDDQADAWERRNFLRRSLGVAAGYEYLRIRIVAVYAANGGASVLIRRRCNRASVENHDLRATRGAGTLETAIEQLPLDGSAVGLGGPASEVLNMVGRHGLIILSAKLRLGFKACIGWV
jgi:hypothetical protein